MKSKLDIIGATVATKVREFYKTDSYLGGMIKIDRLLNTEKIGTEVHIYYPKLDRYDEVFVNGTKYFPAAAGTQQDITKIGDSK